MMQGAVGVLILSALVCLGSGHHKGHKGHDHGSCFSANSAQIYSNKLKGGEDNNADNTANILSMVTSANKGFAFQLYRQLAAQTDNQGKNVFFSPSSVSLALAALSVGARGQTHQQLFSGLGFNSSLLTQADVNQAFHGLLTGAAEDISAGTAVFVSDQFKPRPKFLEVLTQSYLAHGKTLNFRNATGSAASINKYVEGKTHGKIDQLVKNLDPDTLMYLISYIYYKGKWQTRFDPARTKEDMFNLEEQNQVPVQMMNMEDQFHTYYDKQIFTWVLRLPFSNSYSMLLMLPDRGRGLAELEEHICPRHYAEWLNGTKKRDAQKYNILIPKFSINTKMNLNSVLLQMGITDMFDAAANFTCISRSGKLSVSQVVHQATLDVDETGATATAVTSAGFVLKTARRVPVLKFDRPFMVLIADSSDNILFMGKVVNPNI